MDVDTKREFKSLGDGHLRRIRRRIAWVAFTLILSAIYLWTDAKVFPRWLELSVVGILAVSVIVDSAFYFKAKAVAETFLIYLGDDGLRFSHHGDAGRVLYSDIQISKVRKRNALLTEIHLRTTFGQTIKLRDLENMQTLYDGLVKRIKRG